MVVEIKHNNPWNVRLTRPAQQTSDKRLLANLESVGEVAVGSVGQSVDVVSGGSGLASVPTRKESAGLDRGI